MTVSIDDWLRVHRWALDPGRCEWCGRAKSVLAHGTDDHPKTTWSMWCPTCEDPRAPADHLEVLPSIHWMIGEVRPVVTGVQGPAVGFPVIETMVWVRQGLTIPASELQYVASSLASLMRACEFETRKPGAWALELREDGSLWGPWCPMPCGWRTPKSGAPLPYREVTLGAANDARSCVSCSAPLQAGDRVWRPYNPGSTLTAAGWSFKAHQSALVCQVCARAVMAKGVETPTGKVFGPLRLVPVESGAVE
jgi:hypothetical protein